MTLFTELNEPTETVIFAGDWHGSIPQGYRGILTAVKEGSNTVVQLGDFGIWPGQGGVNYLDRLELELRLNRVTLYFVDGNHEDFTQLYEYPLRQDGLRQVRPHIMHLPRGHRWTWHGVSFLALGGAHSVDRPMRTPYASWWPEERITDDDVMRASQGGPVDIMVCHDSPASATNRVVDTHVGRESPHWPDAELAASAQSREQLQRVVDAVTPLVLFHGHYHAAMRSLLQVSPDRVCSVIGLNEGSQTGNLLPYYISPFY